MDNFARRGHCVFSRLLSVPALSQDSIMFRNYRDSVVLATKTFAAGIQVEFRGVFILPSEDIPYSLGVPACCMQLPLASLLKAQQNDLGRGGSISLNPWKLSLLYAWMTCRFRQQVFSSHLPVHFAWALHQVGGIATSTTLSNRPRVQWFPGRIPQTYRRRFRGARQRR